MSRGSRRKPRTGTARIGGCRALIIIDEAPIRRKAINKCRSILTRFDEAAQEIDRYHDVDVPAYRRWIHQEFATRLTEIRELASEVDRLEALITRIEYLKAIHRVSFHEAWKLATTEPDETDADDPFGPRDDGFCGNDDWDDDWDDEFEDDEGWDDDEPDEEELLEVFMSIIYDIPGHENLDPDSDEFERLFSEFRASFRTDRSRRDEEDDDDEPVLFAPTASDDILARVKALYRSLVKKLHPDFRDGSQPELDEMWHRVQKAYHDGDLDSLSALSAGYEIRSRGDIAALPVSNILAVHEDHKQRLSDLRRIRRQLKQEPSWGFAGADPERIANMRREMASDLEGEASTLRGRKAYLDGTIARWSARPGDSQRPAKKVPYVSPKQTWLF